MCSLGRGLVVVADTHARLGKTRAGCGAREARTPLLAGGGAGRGRGRGAGGGLKG